MNALPPDDIKNNKLETVNYDALDTAKLKFIEASKRTLNFASQHGFVADSLLGASANIFNLSLKPFIEQGLNQIQITLLPEGLGTADDARPDDLTSSELTQFWFNIGIKAVAVMTNDAASSGIQTILVGMYLPSGDPAQVFTPEFLKGFLDGYVEGCKQVGCVYISGETPQLKNKLYPDKLDIAGALFGLIPAGKKAISSTSLKSGDYIVLVESSGPHENGFTTLRALANNLESGYRTDIGNGQQFWQAINEPSKLYTGLIQEIINNGIELTNAENITGHGWQKIMRSKKSLTYAIDDFPKILPVFEFVKEKLYISYEKLFSVFNCGSGLALFCSSKEDAEKIVNLAKTLNFNAIVAGQVKESKKSTQRSVVITKLGVELKGEEFLLSK